jgi:fructokinase
MSLYGAVEAGGTKFVVAVGEDPAQPRDIQRIPTSANPRETMEAVLAYFEKQGSLRAIGVASFGPISYASGCITNTPKLAWQNFPLRDTLRRALNVPIGFDTDVNGAALGEARCGAGQGLENLVYITVGTGIGGGALVGGQLVHGLLHPEMGHTVVRRAPGELESFDGVCPFHRNCLEGMASGPAMQARWNTRADQLPSSHEAWRIEADYLAQACINLACILSPQAIVLGGGVMEQRQLFPMIQARAAQITNGYLPLPAIVPPGCEYPGLSGALALALGAAER